jgi:hypothetical protein
VNQFAILDASTLLSTGFGFSIVRSKSNKLFCLALCALLFALCMPAWAQQPAKVPRIGYLSSGDPTTASARFEVMRQALREMGYIEGQNIVIEYRYREGKPIDILISREN